MKVIKNGIFMAYRLEPDFNYRINNTSAHLLLYMENFQITLKANEEYQPVGLPAWGTLRQGGTTCLLDRS